MKIKRTIEEECCSIKPWKEIGYREYQCTYCGQKWIKYKTLDASGNWDWEYEKKP